MAFWRWNKSHAALHGLYLRERIFCHTDGSSFNEPSLSLTRPRPSHVSHLCQVQCLGTSIEAEIGLQQRGRSKPSPDVLLVNFRKPQTAAAADLRRLWQGRRLVVDRRPCLAPAFARLPPLAVRCGPYAPTLSIFTGQLTTHAAGSAQALLPRASTKLLQHRGRDQDQVKGSVSVCLTKEPPHRLSYDSEIRVVDGRQGFKRLLAPELCATASPAGEVPVQK